MISCAATYLVAEHDIDGDDGHLRHGDHAQEEDDDQIAGLVVVARLVLPGALEDEEQLDEDYNEGYESGQKLKMYAACPPSSRGYLSRR